MSSDVERIKELLDISDVVGEYIELKKAGSHYKANCPFHNEKTPSFIVSPDRGTYHCFGCGVSGDVFSFVQEFEGLDFRGALQVLAKKAGVEITSKDGVFKEKKDRLLKLNEEASKFFEENIKNSKESLDYLKKRGVIDQTQKKWRLGYSFSEWRSLLNYLKNKGISEIDMMDAGLVKKREEKIYDTFRDRIMFPIFDLSGNVIAFSGRALNPTDKNPKYLNSPDTEIFNKSEVLYGLDKASRSIRRMGYVIMVEGQFDLIMSHQVGITNTVALSGTSVTEGHIKKLSRLTKNVLLAFDSDNAGINSAYKTASMALKQGMDVKIAKIPKEKDPADCIYENKSEWRKILTEAPHAVLHTLEYIEENFSEGRKKIKAVREYTFPMLLSVNSEMDRAYFLSIVAEKLNLPIENVESDMDGYISQNKNITGYMDNEEDLKEESLVNRNDASVVERIIISATVLLKWLESCSEPVYSVEKLRSKIHSADSEFAKEISVCEVELGKDKEVLEIEEYCSKLDSSGVTSYSDELIFRYKTAKLEKLMDDLQNKIKRSTEDEDLNREYIIEYQKYSRELHEIIAGRQKGEIIYINNN